MLLWWDAQRSEIRKSTVLCGELGESVLAVMFGIHQLDLGKVTLTIGHLLDPKTFLDWNSLVLEESWVVNGSPRSVFYFDIFPRIK